MKLEKTINAIKAVNSMIGHLDAPKTWAYDLSLALVLLNDRLSVPYQFYQREEREIIERYATEREDSTKIDNDGRYTIKAEDVDSFRIALTELLTTDFPYDYEPIKVKIPKEIPPACIIALRDFITFEESEYGG